MTHRNHQRRTQRRAFTLLEVLIVVAIIVVLAGLGTYFLLPQLDQAKADLAKPGIETLSKAAQTYKIRNGDFPASLAQLAQYQPDGSPPIVEEKALVDPWGQAYQYDPSGAHHDGLKPDIWTTNPTNGVVIANWVGN
jgi:general secretion pathway protein G